MNADYLWNLSRVPGRAYPFALTKAPNPCYIAALSEKQIRAWNDAYSTAGREGFEPSVDRSPQRFSRPSHSTTLAPPREVSRARFMSVT